MKHPERFGEVTLLRRDVHSRRLGPGLWIRMRRVQVARHLVLLKVPDAYLFSFHLQCNHFVLIVERLVEGAILCVETAALRRWAIERPMAVC